MAKNLEKMGKEVSKRVEELFKSLAAFMRFGKTMSLELEALRFKFNNVTITTEGKIRLRIEIKR